MKVDRQYLENVIAKYDLASVAEVMKDALGFPAAKIGFVGPFSSGKTSIINALLGTNLPVDIKPTTKSICIIEPVAGLNAPKYFRDQAGCREPVDFMAICDIINGDADGDAVVQVPPGDVLHEGMLFVDTPGIDSIGREEADLTYSYLSMMDAAVVCIPVDDGTVKKSVIDFICSPHLKPFATRLVFLLTKSDIKSPDAVAGIRGEIVRQLEGLCRDGHLPISETEINKRVLAVSREDINNEFVSFMETNFFKNLPELIAERESKEFHRIAGEMVAILSERAGALSLDASQYEKAISEANVKLSMIAEEEVQKKRELSELTDKLQSRLFDVMMSCKSLVTSATDTDTRRMAISEMLERIKNEVTSFCQASVKSFVPGPGIVASIDDRLNSAMANIDRVRDLSVMGATSVATAFFCPGAGVAANAGEAVAGAVGQQTAKAGAKAAAARVAKAAAKTVAEEAAKKPSFITKALGGIATIIKEINPLETVGDIVAEKFKSSSFDEVARSSAWSIADRVVADLAAPYRQEVIAPLRIRMEEVKRGLERQRQLRHEDAERIRKVHAEMQSEIEGLRAYAKGE
ncbi:MAG: dynamin family protein [Kiritimatiellia bacterium]